MSLHLFHHVTDVASISVLLYQNRCHFFVFRDVFAYVVTLCCRVYDRVENNTEESDHSEHDRHCGTVGLIIPVVEIRI